MVTILNLEMNEVNSNLWHMGDNIKVKGDMARLDDRAKAEAVGCCSVPTVGYATLKCQVGMR